MNILLRNRYFRRECFTQTFTHKTACHNDQLWYFDYIDKYDDYHVLCYASRHGILSIVQKASIHCIHNCKREWLLSGCISNGHIDIVKYLLSKCPTYKEEVLYRGSAEGHLKIVKYAIEQGADVHYNDDSALYIASSTGYIDIVQYLVEQGADIHAKNDKALRFSAYNGRLSVVQYLVEHGANIHIDSLLYNCSSDKGNYEVIKYLTEQGANINDKRGYRSVLSHSAEQGDLNLLRFGIEQGADLNYYVINMGAYYGHLHIVRYLVEEVGYDIHEGDDGPLSCSAGEGYIDIVRYLLERGANVHADEDRALQFGAEDGHFDVVRLLVEWGADIHARDDIALHNSAIHGHTEIAKYLIEQGAHIQKGLLSKCAKQGNYELVRYMVEHGADIHKEECDLLVVSAVGGSLDLVKYLIGLGVEVPTDEETRDYILCLCADHLHLDIMQYFVEEHGFPINKEMPVCYRHDDYYKKFKCLDVLRYLLEWGADVHYDDDHALRYSSYDGNLEVVQLLVEHGGNIHACNDEAINNCGSSKVKEYLLSVLQKNEQKK